MFDIPFALYIEELEGRLDTPQGIENRKGRERYEYEYEYDDEFYNDDEEFSPRGYRYFWVIYQYQDKFKTYDESYAIS